RSSDCAKCWTRWRADRALGRRADGSGGACAGNVEGQAAMGHSILITGGAGYLGSILVPELLAAGHKVAVLDNFMFQQNSLAAVCHLPNFSVVNGDARQEDTLRPLVKEADYIFPLAALVGA